jgi:hypothetical protein
LDETSFAVVDARAAVPALVDFLRRTDVTVDLFAGAAWALYQISFYQISCSVGTLSNQDKEACTVVDARAAFPVLVDLLRRTDANVDVLAGAAWALYQISCSVGTLSNQDKEACAVVDARAAFPVLVDLLRRTDVTVVLLEGAAWALYQISFGVVTLSNQDKDAFVVVDARAAVPVLVDLLRRSEDNVDQLIAGAAGTLYLICSFSNDSEEFDAVAIHTAIEAGAIPLLLNHLRRSDNLDVRALTVAALAIIGSFSVVGTHAVFESGAIHVLLDLIRQTRKTEFMEKVILKYVASMFGDISDLSEEHACAVVKAGAVPLLVNAMRTPNRMKLFIADLGDFSKMISQELGRSLAIIICEFTFS